MSAGVYENAIVKNKNNIVWAPYKIGAEANTKKAMKLSVKTERFRNIPVQMICSFVFVFFCCLTNGGIVIRPPFFFHIRQAPLKNVIITLMVARSLRFTVYNHSHRLDIYLLIDLFPFSYICGFTTFFLNLLYKSFFPPSS